MSQTSTAQVVTTRSALPATEAAGTLIGWDARLRYRERADVRADPFRSHVWVADALAWSHSAGGTWRARIADITAAEDVSAP